MSGDHRRGSSSSSYAVFMSFIREESESSNNGTRSVDVSPMFSLECYTTWLGTRSAPPKRPEESFRKAITSHCRGVDGRKPFPQRVEAALLVEMRKKQVWPCFSGTRFNIGKRGYQVRGFWEAQQLKSDSNDHPDKTHDDCQSEFSGSEISGQGSCANGVAGQTHTVARRIRKSHPTESEGDAQQPSASKQIKLEANGMSHGTAINNSIPVNVIGNSNSACLLPSLGLAAQNSYLSNNCSSPGLNNAAHGNNINMKNPLLECSKNSFLSQQQWNQQLTYLQLLQMQLLVSNATQNPHLWNSYLQPPTMLTEPAPESEEKSTRSNNMDDDR